MVTQRHAEKARSFFSLCASQILEIFHIFATYFKTMSKTSTKTIEQFHALIQARYDLSLVEKRASYVIINEVGARLAESGKVGKTPREDLELRIKTTRMTKANLELREVYDALKSLSEKSITIVDGAKTVNTRFISRYEHQKHLMNIDVVVPHVMLPYITAFAEHFTAERFAVAMSIGTKHGQRFYEYCLQYGDNDDNPEHAFSGYFCFTLQELVHKLKLDNKYRRFAHIKECVIGAARKELKTLYDAGRCAFYFEHDDERSGKAVERLHFYVYRRLDG